MNLPKEDLKVENASLPCAGDPQSQSVTSPKLRSRLFEKLVGAVERANPILVKETRQSLKSRQFVVTFMVVLVACWIASFAVVAIVGPDVYYTASGAQMLLVYSIILAFPLVLIVPFSAFRSIAAEQEENTFDLLSITTLSSRKIVLGKLGSAGVQMLIYLCAVSPCIAFTFLLRGVDFLTVVSLLVIFVLGSMGLSMVGLLAGTLSQTKHTQILVSLLFVLCLVLVFYWTCHSLVEFIGRDYVNLRSRAFWFEALAFMTFYVTTFLLVLVAAAAQIAFPSENRSTPLRKCMLLQQACFVGWLSLGFVGEIRPEISLIVILVGASIGLVYWYFMGSLLTSEWPHLSRRVMRSLPQSTLERMFLTWLNPGPSTGFGFAVSNYTFFVVVGLLLANLLPTNPAVRPTPEHVNYFLIISWSYLVIFVGLGKLIIDVLRRFTFVPLSAGFLVHLVMLLIACGIPQVVFLMTPTLRMGNQFSMLQISNPVWVLFALYDTGPAFINGAYVAPLLAVIALIVLLVNFRAAAHDVRLMPKELPTRVSEEVESLTLKAAEAPSNPWETTQA